jgi:AraC family transcriptional regulator of adaptative response/methylated-DNA-[protein]-cysteine methyltransferase
MEKSIPFNRIMEAVACCKPATPTAAQGKDAAAKALLAGWAGVSPEQFAGFVSTGYARQSITGAQAGNSTTGDAYPVHSSLISLLPMQAEEYAQGGKQLHIHYSYAETPFGSLILAATHKGICYAAFYDGSQEQAFAALQQQFPRAQYVHLLDRVQQNALFFFTRNWQQLDKIVLHVKGTPFQLRVWEALLRIPAGALSTYAAIAAGLQQPKASRAVGAAVGDNPIAFLIPCHRVILSTGSFGQYHWGILRKTAMIGWEATRAWLHNKKRNV